MAGKPVRISGHARFEMQRRGIKPADVIAVIRQPGQVLPSTKSRHIYQSRVGRAGRWLLRVVVKEDKQAYLVITAYKTTQIAKYWRQP